MLRPMVRVRVCRAEHAWVLPLNRTLAMDQETRERRLKERAHRRGWCLERSPATDRGDAGFGTYRVKDLHKRRPVQFQSVVHYRCTEDGFGLTLDDVERLLNEST